jgi:hypothetical protein
MKADIYIKDEGYMDVRVHRNLKAQEFCHSLGIENSLLKIGKTYCGEPVWEPGYKGNDAMFSFVLNEESHDDFINACKIGGLVVMSEFGGM